MKKTPTQTMQSRVTKFFVIFTSILLLLAVLAGCSGSGSSSSKLEIVNQATNELNDKDEFLGVRIGGTVYQKGNLKANQINSIANMVASAYNSDSNFRVLEYLVAAFRGYDMLDPNFKDEEYEKFLVSDKADAAITILDKANEKAETKIEKSDYEKLNVFDLKELIAVFQTEIDTKDSSGLMVTIGKFLNLITQNLGGSFYIIGICEFAVLIEILMIPFAILQQRNSIKQAKLRPKEMAIRNKYAGRNDQKTQQQVQREIQELYQKENFSPFSGCLPLLLQMPILIALYQIVINPLHYVLGISDGVSQTALTTFYTTARAAGGLGFSSVPSNTIGVVATIQEKGLSLEGLKNFAFFSNSSAVYEKLNDAWSNLPNFNIGKFNFGLTPNFTNFNILLLVPVLTFVVYFFSMKLNRKFGYQPSQGAPGQPADRQAACSNTMMDVSMPAMSTFFTFVVPAIIGVYWIFRSVLGVLKQFIMSKIMPLPKFTEEDYKAAAKALAGKKQPVVKSENAGRVRSLHHIDDEDYDDTREAALARKAAMEAEERKKQEAAGKTPVEGAMIKEDRPARKEKKKKETVSDEKPEDSDFTGNND